MDSTPNNGKLLFDVGGTFLKAVIADGNGRFVPDTEYSVPMPSDGPREEIEQALIAAVERGMRSAADRGLRIGCTGIAFPGPFDFGLGIPLMTHKFRNIYGISLLDLLRQLRRDYPEAKIVGHCQLSPYIRKACPCFDAREEYAGLEEEVSRK